MATQTPSELINAIHSQRQSEPLKILGYSETLLQPESQSQPSDTDRSTPASLLADLTHYRDLFSKLRFSFSEQITKEKYIRCIVGQDPPNAPTAEENAALEAQVSAMKADLKSKKRANEALIAEMEELAREIARRYENVNGSLAQLETVPGEIEALEAEVQNLKEQIQGQEGTDVSEDPRMNLSLEETERLIGEQRQKNEELAKQIEEMEAQLPDKMRESERAMKELEEIESRKNEVTKAVLEMQRRKESGGRDLLEEQGRWYQSSATVMKALLGQS